MKNLSKKGFTLVELIIVVTILAILGTIAFVAFQGIGEKASKTANVSTLKSMASAIGNYKNEAGTLPSAYKEDGSAVVQPGQIGQLSSLSSLKSKLEGAKTDLDGTYIIDGNPVWYATDSQKKYFSLGVKFKEGGKDKALIYSTYPVSANGKSLLKMTNGGDFVTPTVGGEVEKLASATLKSDGTLEVTFSDSTGTNTLSNFSATGSFALENPTFSIVSSTAGKTILSSDKGFKVDDNIAVNGYLPTSIAIEGSGLGL